jgi:hypothetical protein
VGSPLLSRLRAYMESLDEFTSKQELSTVVNTFAAILWVQIIVKCFPFLEWVDAKSFKKNFGKYRSALGRRVFARNASALVTAWCPYNKWTSGPLRGKFSPDWQLKTGVLGYPSVRTPKSALYKPRGRGRRLFERPGVQHWKSWEPFGSSTG